MYTRTSSINPWNHSPQIAFPPNFKGLFDSVSGPLANNNWMAATIAVITFLILCGTLSLSVLDARMESKTAQMATSLQAANAELQHLVVHDTLTKLPNRMLLEDRVQFADMQLQ